MSGYTPQVGDKVRATLGESVLVGGVANVSGDGDVTVWVDHNEHDAAVYISLFPWRWQFEQVVSVPSKFGAVIRRADGVKFVLVYPRDTLDGWMRSDDDDDYPAEYATVGGFTILFDGVDE